MTGRVNKLIYWRVFPIYGMSSFPLTNSMIFQDGWNHQPATTEGLFSPKISDRWQKADADCACVEGCSEIGYTVQLGMVLTKFIELDDGKIYRKALYLMVKTMVSCRFSLKPTQWRVPFDHIWSLLLEGNPPRINQPHPKNHPPQAASCAPKALQETGDACWGLVNKQFAVEKSPCLPSGYLT